MDEFKRQGGSLTGREERTDAFGGEPRAVGGTLGGHGAKGTTSLTENDDGLGNNASHHTGHHNGANTGVGSTTGSTATSTGKPSLMDKINPKVDANGDGKAGFMK